MTLADGTLWRAFPWRPEAQTGEPFSPGYIPPGQHSGRFDLHDEPPVLYLAETPEHAVAEIIQAFRGRQIDDKHLERHGQPLALAQASLRRPMRERVLDLTAPPVLGSLGLRPDMLASQSRDQTQAIARLIHDRPAPGFRWWSALTGDWHTVVLFADAIAPDDIDWRPPELLSIASPVVREAAAQIGVRLR